MTLAGISTWRYQARQGKLVQAEATHRRATQCSHGQIDEAYHNLGLVLRGQGRLGELPSPSARRSNESRIIWLPSTFCRTWRQLCCFS